MELLQGCQKNPSVISKEFSTEKSFLKRDFSPDKVGIEMTILTFWNSLQ